MKKTFLIFAALFLFLAAAFSKTKKEDPYNEKKLLSSERTAKNGVQSILSSTRYDVLDDCSFFVKTFTNKMKVKKGNYIYRGGTDIAGFRGHYDTSAYAVQMAKEARETCIAAIDRYCADFEAKALNRKLKYTKTRQLYGKTEVYVEFGVAMDMMNYKARPIATFGYVFENNSPYFVIHMDKAQNLVLKGKSSADYGNFETIVLNFYFTRKQALALKEFIKNDNVDALMGKYDNSPIELDAQNDATEYFEADDTVPETNKKPKKGKKSEPAKSQDDESYSESDEEITNIKY